MPEVQGAFAMDREATPEEVDAVEEVVRRAGFEGPVEASVVRKSMGELPWIIYVSAPVLWFLKTLVEEAAKDAYPRIKDFFRALRQARQDRRGDVVVVDRDTGTRLNISSELPDEAYDALEDLDWSKLEGGYLLWDEEKGWYDSSPGSE